MIKILMIEDFQELRTKTVKILQLLGFSTDEACDGEQGYNKIMTGTYHLVICDIKMPKMDGYTLLEKVRNNEKTKNILFIFLTSNIERGQIRKGMTIGADDYITKPFTKDELIDSIKACLKKRRDLSTYFEQKFETEIKKIETIAFINPRTQLPNENALYKEINELYETREYTYLGFLLIHIIGLNEIAYFLSSDSFKKMLNILTDNMISVCDINTDIFMISDDNFLLMIKSNDGEDVYGINEQLIELAKKIIMILTRPICQEYCTLIFKISIGIHAITVVDNDGIETIIKKLKTAQQFADKSGYNMFKLYSPVIDKDLKGLMKDTIKQHIMPAHNNHTGQPMQARSLQDNYEVKVFFLSPPSVVKEDLVKELVGNEYEAYIIKDERKLLKYLKIYNHSIVFINIDAGESEKEWEEYIKYIKQNPATQSVRIGILSYQEKTESQQVFLLKLMVECGYIQLKLGFEESKNIILKTLAINEAKGKRKYIRVNCNDPERVYFTLKGEVHLTYEATSPTVKVRGTIQTISSVGMSCTFDNPKIEFKERTVFNEIQLNLKGVLCMIDGQITYIREVKDGGKVYIIMFNDAKYKTFQERVHSFIYKSLQESIEKEFNEL